MACALRCSIVAGTVPTGEARPKSSMVTCPRGCAKTLSATLRATHRPVRFDRSSLTGRGTQASEAAPCDHPSCRAARARRQWTSRRQLHGGARTRPRRKLFRPGGNRRRRRDGELGKPSRRRSCFPVAAAIHDCAPRKNPAGFTLESSGEDQEGAATNGGGASWLREPRRPPAGRGRCRPRRAGLRAQPH